MKNIAFLIICLFTNTFAHSQNLIVLTNPSFEDRPAMGKAPEGWGDCGEHGETPPDVQPSSDEENLFFNVSKPSYDGKTYLALVVRDNDTWEAVGQELSTPLIAKEKYHFSIYLARPEYYLSKSRLTNIDVNYTYPVKFRIFGTNEACGRGELLAESQPIVSVKWKEYSFELEPTETYDYLILESYSEKSINGCLFLDNASAIARIPAEKNTLATNDIEELKNQIINCRNLEIYNDHTKRTFKESRKIRDLILFQSAKEIGFLNFLSDTPKSSFGDLINDLNQIGALELSKELIRFRKIKVKMSKDKDLSGKDLKSIEEFENKIDNLLIKDKLKDKISKFLLDNTKAIEQELFYCN